MRLPQAGRPPPPFVPRPACPCPLPRPAQTSPPVTPPRPRHPPLERLQHGIDLARLLLFALLAGGEREHRLLGDRQEGGGGRGGGGKRSQRAGRESAGGGSRGGRRGAAPAAGTRRGGRCRHAAPPCCRCACPPPTHARRIPKFAAVWSSHTPRGGGGMACAGVHVMYLLLLRLLLGLGGLLVIAVREATGQLPVGLGHGGPGGPARARGGAAAASPRGGPGLAAVGHEGGLVAAPAAPGAACSAHDAGAGRGVAVSRAGRGGGPAAAQLSGMHGCLGGPWAGPRRGPGAGPRACCSCRCAGAAPATAPRARSTQQCSRTGRPAWRHGGAQHKTCRPGFIIAVARKGGDELLVHLGRLLISSLSAPSTGRS
jgi:hypothetical protein